MYDPDKYLHQPKDNELVWVGVDLDQTLAEGVWPESEGIGAPIEKNIDKLKAVYAKGYKAIIYTSRPWSHYQRIEAWLTDHQIPFKAIVCGKPMFVRYVDDKGVNADAETWV